MDVVDVESITSILGLGGTGEMGDSETQQNNRKLGILWLHNNVLDSNDHEDVMLHLLSQTVEFFNQLNYHFEHSILIYPLLNILLTTFEILDILN